ncbi:hypothetical protein UA08_06267 [Talaromyces atroroseus]|uniref:F-box domain-containing protein n=1 Tax=Talaromyces atroroseus TaxID=1441469 RepID=A0A225ASD2_TALAT|nr:hypothetical protein UA08_06267 [Talaromyces atroroseus]OKL58509.1 hypothetical protein UA08_06267 [Talaromyces atroroseus]
MMDHSAGAPASQEPLSNQDTAVKTSESYLSSAETRQEDGLFPGRKRKHYSSEEQQVGNRRVMIPVRGGNDDDDGGGGGDDDDNDDIADLHYTQSSPGRAKKPRLGHDKPASDRSQLLPMEIWHYIFSFLDPKALGVLLRVSRTFHGFLTKDRDPLDSSASAKGVLKPVSSNFIWSSARKLFHPGMPRPLANMTELDMWRLIRATNCEVCGKNDSSPPSPTSSSAWERGPGINGVRIFWPFGIRACCQCFLTLTKKDVDLVLSPLPTFLLPGLSFVLMTPYMHMVPSVVLRSNESPPADLHLTKYYFNSDIEYLMQEFDHVKSLGPATLEEWIKGLESKGKRKMADTARWEQWENSGGLYEVRLDFRGQSTNNDPRSKSSHHHSMPQDMSRSEHPTLSPFRGLAHNGVPSVPPGFITNSSPSKLDQSRGGRSLRDVDEAKASRRAEIERRCLALRPPLTAPVLSHMESFSAAIQIPHELTDKDWEYLKPRLLAQREMAEKKEIDRLQESRLLQAKTEERRQQEARSKQEKESLDHQWDDAQRLIHDQINMYADEIIAKNRNDGATLSKDKCAQFAADVLMHVRSRFYAHIQEEDAIARASGVAVKADSPDAPPTRKLVLENMKWVYDTKIKPLTEKYSKELFLCNGCENNSRLYGFEGVVQHYAAKHTTALSAGSVIVFWRAEWPEKPPFHPNPNAARALLHASSQGGGFGQPLGYPRQQQSTSGLYMATPEQRHCILPDAHPSSHTYGRSPFRSPYTTYMHGPFQPPSPRTSPYYSGYVFPPPSPAMEPSAFDQPSAYNSPYHGHVVPVNYQTHLPQAPHPYPSPAYGSASPSNQSLLYKVPHGSNRNAIAHHRDTYKTQLDHMARVAREVWNATSGIKDLPNSIRAHVLIYHVAITTQHQFNIDASVALFADGLNNHPQMKPMRGLSGLVCKCCTNGDSPKLPFHPRNPKSYGFSALLSHFQSLHMEHVKNGTVTIPDDSMVGLDWKTDMIALPDLSSLKSLSQNPGMDDFKLRIIAQALPEAFPSSLPALPPETFITKRSPAMHQAYVTDRQSHYPSPTLHNAKKEDYASASVPRAVPADGVSVSSVSEGIRFPPDSLSRRNSPNTLLRHDGRGHGLGNRYVTRSPRAVILRSPRYIRLQDEWVYREDDVDEVSSEHHDRFYIPVSTRSAMSDRSDYPYKSEQFESEIPIQQQRVERQANISRQTGQSSEGSVFPKNAATPLTTEHEDSRSNAGDMSAAEQFLSTFVPGQESQASDTRNDSVSVSKHERHWRPMGAGDDVSERGGLTYYGSDEWKRWGSPGIVRAHEIPRESRAEWVAAQRTRSPDVIQLRYGRKLSGAMESKLPPSRFDRYEALRQESLRPRSRSPPSAVKEDIPRDVLYFEDQDPRLQQSRLLPQHISDPAHRYSRLERESSMSSNARRNATGYRPAGVIREPAYYDDTIDY